MVTVKKSPPLPELTPYLFGRLKFAQEHHVSPHSPIVTELIALGLVEPSPYDPSGTMLTLQGYRALLRAGYFDVEESGDDEEPGDDL